MNFDLRTDRDCGECCACCRELRIDEFALKKLPRITCKYYVGGVKGCCIYETRPSTCSTFQCGWWWLPVGEEWRPDRSGILVLWQYQNAATGAVAGVKFHFIGGLEAVLWHPFLQLVCELGSKGVPLYVSVPAPIGYSFHIGLLNSASRFREAVATQDFALIGNIASRLVQSCIDGPREKIVFTNPPND